MKLKIIAIASLILISLVLFGCTQAKSDNQKINENTIVNNADIETKENTTASNKADIETKEFTINAKQSVFEPSTIKVKLGDKVKLTLTSLDVSHGFTLPEFEINETIPAGKSIQIEFIASKKGNFEFYCSVYCGAEHSQMKGTLIVE